MFFTRRRLIVLLFVPCAMACGFVAGGAIGAFFIVQKTSGIAGPFMVIGYGIIGAVTALGISLLLVFRTRGAVFSIIAMTVIATGIVSSAVSAWLVLKTGGAPITALAARTASLPNFDLRLQFLPAIDELPFASFEYEGGLDTYSVRYLDGLSCGGKLDPASAEKLTLLVALRHVEELMTQDPAPCIPPRGDIVADLRFTIFEHTPPDTGGAIALTMACIDRHDAIEDLLASVEQVEESLSATCN